MVLNEEEMKHIDNEVFQSNPNENKANQQDDCEKKFLHHKDFTLAIKFHPLTPSLFCSGSGDSTSVLWDLNKPIPVFVFKGHTDTVSFVDFNYDGKLIATGSLDGTVRIWDLDNGKLKWVLEGPSDELLVFFLIFI